MPLQDVLMQNNLAESVSEYLEFLERSWEPALEQAAGLAAQFPAPKEFLLFGSGDSHFAALGLSMLLGRATRTQVLAARAMDAARYILPAMHQSSSDVLAFGFSVSGEVARTIEGIEVANTLGIHTVAVTSSTQSTLASTADTVLSLDLPALQIGPGLPGYSAALLLGTAIGHAYASPTFQKKIMELVLELPAVLSDWIPDQIARGESFAQTAQSGATVFVGCGPAYASALFGAAKLIEFAGEYAWAQDIEEWCHLEYFCAEPAMPTIVLSSGGRGRTREEEMLVAAKALGRQVLTSRWNGAPHWPQDLREMLSPFALWAAPAAFALKRRTDLGQEPFRGFGGGRSQAEGGGVSRIRSSQRLSLNELRLLP
jgi:glucosamine--fructose-6-phosphate aminotransferase (isomerizing)